MYKKRIADILLERKLAGKGAVLIEGPKWCGKTTTASMQAKSILDLGDSEILKESKSMIEISPRKLLEGETPRLIDEWQTLPALWDSIRNLVDKRQEVSQFILTGSSVLPEAYETTHSGTGRIGRIRMRPMSLYESEESNGRVSLKNLFEGKDFEVQENSLTIDDIAFLVCRGGWPASISMRREIALDQALDYIDSVANYDIQRVDGTKRDPQRVYRLLRSYARNIAGQISYSTFKTDMMSNDTDTLSEDTVADYIKALKRLFVIEDLEAWNPNLRSKAAIRTSDTRYFVDPSIATASLGIGPDDLINDLESFGLIFETMAVRDLRVYAEALDGKLYHYRDSTGLECDTVLHRRNGTYGLIEIKLGGETRIEEGATNLKNLANKIDTTRMPNPSFMMVLIGIGKYAYRRQDGVYVVPIGCLKP
ncbi:MAG: ATP-binding protein [Paludibacteraceae bacterium]|nr:ATP-binding protein [Paludibacteraceae bacterium]